MRSGDTAPAGQCCCCCCCCLHTIGGVIGAVAAGQPTIKPTDLQPSDLPVSALKGATLEPRYSAHGLYWLLTLIISGVITTLALASERHDRAAATVLVAAIFLPLYQLGASLVAWIVIACSSRVGKEVRLRHLGKITWRSFLGAVIGALVMLPLFSRC